MPIVLESFGELVATELSTASTPLNAEVFAFKLNRDCRAVLGQAEGRALGGGEHELTRLQELMS
ncbi:hypothetical protein [Mycobacterium intermedium]|uniref:hypothetical protein n=1 Tax=Mycobacterium intermedium TaxID=28445 RepID=UPI001E4BF13B|nr:hypothetical protein [Mycobacterium intermedium]